MFKSLPKIERVNNDWKHIHFSSGLIMWTKYPEKFISKEEGWTTILDPNAIYDFSNMSKTQKKKGIIIRVGKRSMVRMCFK